MSWPIAFEDVLAARERLRPHLSPTPLRRYAELDEAVGARVLVKHENHQPTNAFKVRNALSVVTALGPEARARGLIAATRGNHGLGVAWAGSRLGCAVTVCVPVGNNPEKNAAMRGLGATVIEEGRDYDEAVQVMNRVVAERGLHAVHSTNEPLVIAGAGTIVLELLEQADTAIDAMVIACGGGSQAVGAMTVLRRLSPQTRVVAVQAERASAIHDSWRAGTPVVTETAATLADGLATRMPYEVTFGALREGLDDFVLVSEEELLDAIRLVIRTTHNLVEGAGAAGVAGLRKLPGLGGKTVGVVLSGANIDQETLRRALCR